MTILTPEQFKEIYGQKGIDSFKPMQTPLQSKGFLQETKEDISQTIGSLKSTLSGTREKIGDIAETEMAGGQSRIRSLAQTFGIVAGGISEGIGDLFTGAIKTVLPEPAEEKVKAGVQKTIESIVPVATKIDEALGSPVGTFVNK